jgi:hypothetical protein
MPVLAPVFVPLRLVHVALHRLAQPAAVLRLLPRPMPVADC